MATVLVIDDSPDVHPLLAARLKAESVEVLSALTSEDGRALAVACAPDLILLDVDMPHTNGLELCRMLKQDPVTAVIPIMFLTASTDVDTKVHGFDLGAIDYVTKPFDAVELRARVRAALRTKRHHDLLSARAQLDALTGLRNRGSFDQILPASVAHAVGEDRPCALVLLDVDHFKQLNDRFGHPFGDTVLRRIGELVSERVLPGEVAFRYGGEEMAILLPGSTTAEAVARAECLRAALADLAFSPRAEGVHVTASFGVAEVLSLVRVGREPTAATLMAAADGALYDAKRSGRDRVCTARFRGGSRAPAAA